MNQRIEVRSLIRKDGRILLLKRTGTEQGEGALFEIPGGRVASTEQPEEALRRVVIESTGLELQSMYLSDVFTYVDQGDRPAQKAVIVYIASTSGSRGDITLHHRYSRYIWKKTSDIAQDELTELTQTILQGYQDRPGTTASVDGVTIQSGVDYTVKKQGTVTLYSDGGSRGNPGPSAAGYIVKDADGRLVYEGGVYLGITTNNQAEYHGVRLGLEKAKELGVKSIECYIDSMLVVNQLNGQYVIRNRELWPVHERIKELIGEFDKVTFRHVKREFNQQADSMVNKILDARTKK